VTNVVVVISELATVSDNVTQAHIGNYTTYSTTTTERQPPDYQQRGTVVVVVVVVV